jgi:hypothetical protein
MKTVKKLFVHVVYLVLVVLAGAVILIGVSAYHWSHTIEKYQLLATSEFVDPIPMD